MPPSPTRDCIKLTPTAMGVDADLDVLEEWLWTLAGLESIERRYDGEACFLGLTLIGIGLSEDSIATCLTQAQMGSAWCCETQPGIEEADWAETWKQHWHVMHLLPDVVVQPSWETYTAKPKEIVLHLDPGSAFGTGTHETTQLMLWLLRDAIQPSTQTLLDVGTGSGILAIYAALKGVPQVSATDNDPLAVKVALDNAQQNKVTFAISERELSTFRENSFEIIVANILANPLQMLMPEFKRCLAPQGLLLLSGITVGQLPQMQDSLKANQLVLKRVLNQGGWLGLVATHG